MYTTFDFVWIQETRMGHTWNMCFKSKHNWHRVFVLQENTRLNENIQCFKVSFKLSNIKSITEKFPMSDEENTNETRYFQGEKFAQVDKKSYNHII